MANWKIPLTTLLVPIVLPAMTTCIAGPIELSVPSSPLGPVSSKPEENNVLRTATWATRGIGFILVPLRR